MAVLPLGQRSKMRFRLFMAHSTVSFWEHPREADGCFGAK